MTAPSTTHVPIRIDHPLPETLNAQIRYLLDTQPEATALYFVTPDGKGEQTISTRAFFEHAAEVARALRQNGIQAGDLVVLVLEHSLDVLYSFWGAILLGAVPSIFPFLTEKLDPDRYFESLHALVERSGVRLIITYPALYDRLNTVLADVAGMLPILGTDRLTTGGNPTEFWDYAPTAESTAFLQHSSGSTGLQKGVMLSHRAVLNQLAGYSTAIRLQANDVICSWLPLYHDMGLIAGFIMPLMQGIPLVLMSPFHWVRAPHILLHAIQKYRGTLCWLPNFAYNLLATRVRDVQLENLDLSSMRAFINCSEPVRADSHQIFQEKYTPYGLTSNALTVSYAMAENTFAVTQSGMDGPQKYDRIRRLPFQEQNRAMPAAGDDEWALVVVSCGKPIPNCEVRVVDGDKKPLPERQIGEIALRSNSMLTGYYHQAEISAQALYEGWYLTGDLGYMVEGELYVTGRKKDLIIVGGKNIYPQDIEAIVSQIDGVKDGRTVAFGVFNEKLGTEDIAVIAEITQDDEETQGRIQREARQRIVQATDVNARFVHLVGPKWLIKTSSGKIARNANREKFLQEMAAEGLL
ncbi:MAG: AMP-binding protein [Chloroflexi bacterium]|nr:AMP-binding protein [Chloroflexota bacterium]